MIVQISGKLIEKNSQSVVIDVNGLYYDVMIPVSVLQRIDEIIDADNKIRLVTYHYFQIGPASGFPFLIGFMNEVERDFFMSFIKVSGIGPRAAVRALNQPISEITQAIDAGDTKYLTTLPGIGMQRAKEIVAKLQGKVGKYGLIQDKPLLSNKSIPETVGFKEEALEVLIQLQYKKPEAVKMIETAIDRNSQISNTEELLNEIYKLRMKN